MKLEESAFDSLHYDLRIARLSVEPFDGGVELQQGLETARRERFDVVFLRLADTHGLCEVVSRRGVTPVDVLVTSTLGATGRAMKVLDAVTIEFHERLGADDVDVVAAMTADTITSSHLHADPRLPLARTRALYAAWARNDATGRARPVIVARVAGVLAGYLSVLTRADTAVIDLVSVAAAHQGKGLGSAMLASFIAWADKHHLTATVGTQATNPALRLYARHGFVPTEKHLTYHLWLEHQPR